MNTSYRLSGRSLPLEEGFDVIVAGGGPAGSAAAAAAAREGARTLLIESAGALGGMGTLGLVPWFCGYTDGERVIARGIAERIRSTLCERMPGNNPNAPAIDPELLKRTYDAIVTGAGAAIRFHTALCGVERDAAGGVDAVLAASKRGLTAFRAKVYVDATGDGDLAAWAGAEFEKGDAEGGLQPATMCFMLGNVQPYDCWYRKDRPAGSPPSLHFFDPESPVHRALESGKYPFIVDRHSCSAKIGPGFYGYNFGHIYDVDNTDPASVSAALVRGRAQAAQYRELFAEHHPSFKDAFLAATGGLLGTRETRRITGDYRLTGEDYFARSSFPDEIARNAYNLDIHGKEKEEAKRESTDEARRRIHEQIKPFSKGESYGIPYRCLTPRGLRNVLVAGRCISADRRINGSIRIMACCLTTGEAAGAAAALAARMDRPDVHAVDTAGLRATLRAHGAWLP